MRSIVPPRPRRDRRLPVALLVAAVAMLHGLALQAIDPAREPQRFAAAAVTTMSVRSVVELPPPAAPPAGPGVDGAPAAQQARPALVRTTSGAGTSAEGAVAAPAGPAGLEPAPRAVHAIAARNAPSAAPAPEVDLPAVQGSGTASPVERGAAEAVPAAVDAGADEDRPLPAHATALAEATAPAPPSSGIVATVLPAAAAQASVAAAAAAASAGAAEEVPVYATRLPGPVQRRYRLQRGILSGEGEFAWQPVSPGPGSAYEARLLGRVAGLTILDWTSRGRIDAAGVAPERFIVRRLGRDSQAANFQRDAGKITYSGPRTEFALPPGAQDRLSWMVQLPGVLAAEPGRFAQPGAAVNFFVSGARGDADVWVFRVVGREPVTLGDGREVPAIKLIREPRKPYDTRAEVWLEPAMSYLPARARLTPGGGGEPLELTRLPE